SLSFISKAKLCQPLKQKVAEGTSVTWTSSAHNLPELVAREGSGRGGPSLKLQKPHLPEASSSAKPPQLIKCEEDLPTPKPKIELPERFRIRPVTPVEKYIKVLPSPPVPQTTQGFIGWRSAVPGLNKCLELDDEIRSCKGAFARELCWPKQGVH
uniref:Ciliary microtubule inner protein 1 n=1 Tax=Papio anubis TaxID=9555 RepID=A0A8I5R7G6_PAPAN